MVKSAIVPVSFTYQPARTNNVIIPNASDSAALIILYVVPSADKAIARLAAVVILIYKCEFRKAETWKPVPLVGDSVITVPAACCTDVGSATPLP